jgi:hypothetical protein
LCEPQITDFTALNFNHHGTTHIHPILIVVIYSMLVESFLRRTEEGDLTTPDLNLSNLGSKWSEVLISEMTGRMHARTGINLNYHAPPLGILIGSVQKHIEESRRAQPLSVQECDIPGGKSR